MAVRVLVGDGEVWAELWDRAPGGAWWATAPLPTSEGAYVSRVYVKIRKTGRGWIICKN